MSSTPPEPERQSPPAASQVENTTDAKHETVQAGDPPTHHTTRPHFPDHLLSEEGLKKFEAEQAKHHDPLAPPSDHPAGVPRDYRFLSAQDPSTWKKGDDVTWGDHVLNPNKPLSARHREVARLAFLGKTPSEIADRTGFSQSWVSTLLTNTKVQREIDRLYEKAFQATVEARLKDLGPNALDVVEEVLRSNDKEIKPQLKADMARWVVEKLTGKPRQEVDHQSSTLANFMSMIQEMQNAGHVFKAPQPQLGAAATEQAPPAEGGGVIDVTPKKEEDSDLRAWVQHHYVKK